MSWAESWRMTNGLCRQYVIGAIFRDIHIWSATGDSSGGGGGGGGGCPGYQSASTANGGQTLATLPTAIGVVTDFFIGFGDQVSNTQVPWEQFPRSILVSNVARMSLTCYDLRGNRACRSCYGDATTRLLPWNLTLTDSIYNTCGYSFSTLNISEKDCFESRVDKRNFYVSMKSCDRWNWVVILPRSLITWIRLY